MKKLLCLLLLLCSLEVFSGSWEVGLFALYVKPDFSVDHVQDPSSESVSVDDPVGLTDFALGFELEGTYTFNDKRNDLSFSVSNVAETDENQIGVLIGNAGIETVDLMLHPSWFVLDIEWGYTTKYAHLKELRFAVGLEYTRIEVEEDMIIHTAPAALPDTINKNTNRSFSGIGPYFKMDLKHAFTDNLSVYGTGESVLLAGTDTTDVFYPDGFSGGRHDASYNLIPQLAADLGAEYEVTFWQTKFVLDIGWMWISYIQALASENHHYIDEEAERTGSSFSVSGPYLGLSWVGD